MLLKTIAAGAALSMVLAGGTAMAETKVKASAMAGPKQPIPYGQLDAYLKASPKARASKDWWNGATSAGASTGASIDTSANASAPMGSMSGDAKASTDTSVNPAPMTSTPSMPDTPPVLPPTATTPDPASNLPSTQVPPVPKP